MKWCLSNLLKILEEEKNCTLWRNLFYFYINSIIEINTIVRNEKILINLGGNIYISVSIVRCKRD